MPNVRIPLKEGKDAVAIANSKVPQFLADLSPETLNRDECRTPMLWSDQANAGFCDSLAQPWLPIVSTYKTINVANQLQDSTSLLNTYRKLLTLRKSIPALNSGSFTLKKDFNDKNILAYERTDGEASYLVLLNMSKKVKEIEPINGTTIFTTHSDSSTQQLQPYEGRIFQLEN
jgi:oligo-1,6-glucosidase/alpha-glucosidase